MTKQDVKTAIDWAAAEGWNPGIHDAESFYVAVPNGFFIGEIDGEAVATLSAVKYGDSFGFIGFYMVKPAYRGKGYGIQIWNAGIEYLTGRNIGLDGVLEQQENYKKFGFKFAYRNIRYEGINDNAPLPDNSKTVDLAAVSFESIQAYDQSFFPEERSVFLESWVRHADRHAVGIMDGEQLAG
ncbi:MAG: GNAT family N-acetyltransferase, partial [Gammaproteobacteria bacterium]|nr:GNAT family N-acetyltransferase [Gammaproteobacteria bacterium]